MACFLNALIRGAKCAYTCNDVEQLMFRESHDDGSAQQLPGDDAPGGGNLAGKQTFA
jgi:hypothetical protein